MLADIHSASMAAQAQGLEADGAFHPVLPVLWVFQNYDGRWTVRREGCDCERTYPSRERALDDARRLGDAAGCYRLHLQLTDGRFCLELLNPSRRRG